MVEAERPAPVVEAVIASTPPVEAIPPALAADAEELAFGIGDDMGLLTKLGRGSYSEGIRRLDLVGLTADACACARARGIKRWELREIERRIAEAEATPRARIGIANLDAEREAREATERMKAPF